MVNRPQQMSTDPEKILHHAVDGREALEMGGRLKAAHLPLALARRLMGGFGSIVRVLVCPVFEVFVPDPVTSELGDPVFSGCFAATSHRLTF